MKRFIKNIVLFLGVLAIAYPILIFSAEYFPLPVAVKNINQKSRTGSYGYLYSRLQEAKEVNNLDIVFLGSSHTTRGFDTRNFNNLKTFNLGSRAQTPIQTKALLERYIDQLNPKTVLFEVYPRTFELDGVESSLDLIANDKNDIYTAKMALSINNIKTYNALFYNSIVDILQLNKDYVEPIKKGEDTYIPGGYIEKKVRYFKFEEHPKKQWELKDYQLQAFEECLELLKSKNIKVILVYAPLTPNLYKSYTNHKYIDSLYNSYGVDYYNFNEIVQLNDSLHFYDKDHLNSKGVTIFNKKLKEVLKL
jgi:hypothetical protein